MKVIFLNEVLNTSETKELIDMNKVRHLSTEGHIEQAIRILSCSI